MKWYWPISCDNTVGNPYVADEGDINTEEWLLRQGQTAGQWNSSAWIKASDEAHDGEPDDVLQSCLGLPIYSMRLRTALRESGINDIQYLPLRVVRPSGQEIRGFSIANITAVRDALDREQSDISLFADDYVIERRRGQISAVRKPVFVESRIRGCDVFRLDGYLVAYYVSERFKQVFEEHEFTGYSFREVGLSDQTRSMRSPEDAKG